MTLFPRAPLSLTCSPTPPAEPSTPTAEQCWAWDAYAKHGSVAAAAKALGKHPNTISRHCTAYRLAVGLPKGARPAVLEQRDQRRDAQLLGLALDGWTEHGTIRGAAKAACVTWRKARKLLRTACAPQLDSMLSELEQARDSGDSTRESAIRSAIHRIERSIYGYGV